MCIRDSLYYIKFRTHWFVYRSWPDLIRHRDIVYRSFQPGECEFNGKWHRYPFVGTSPQHRQQVDAGDRWSQVGTDCLDVEVQLGALHALDHRDPQDADQNHHAHEYTEHTQTHDVHGGTETTAGNIHGGTENNADNHHYTNSCAANIGRAPHVSSLECTNRPSRDPDSVWLSDAINMAGFMIF